MFFARQSAHSDFATALIRGELVLDGRGCFLISGPGSSLVPVWPTGFEPRVERGKVSILNGRGKTLARVGEGIRGGAASSLEDLGAVEEGAARKIPERCPSKEYWLVGGGVGTTRRD